MILTQVFWNFFSYLPLPDYYINCSKTASKFPSRH